MMALFEEIFNSEEICNFDFPAYYHKRGKMISSGITDFPPMFPFTTSSISLINEQVEELNHNLVELLIDSRGHLVLWYLNAMREQDGSALDMMSPLFKEINRVTRGGINTYKQNGWMVHVLYVFQLVSYNIPNNIIPSSFSNASLELKDTFHIMNKLYWKMTKESRFILNVLALIHDIGVVDGVQNHDKDGEKYVIRILNDLSITPRTLQKNDIILNFDSFVELLRILVANHTLINKISAEESDCCIREKCENILGRLSGREDLNKEHFSDMASMFLLLGMADLIAVDDSLFTVQKFTLAHSSYRFLNSIFLGLPCNRDKEYVALMRLHEMLPEDVYSDLKSDSLNILRQQSVESNQFWDGLYEIYKFEYATAFLKPLKSLEKVLLVLIKIINYISNRPDDCDSSRCIVKFDSSMNFNTFNIAVNSGDFESCMDALYDRDTFNGKLLNMKRSITNSLLLLEISDTPFS